MKKKIAIIGAGIAGLTLGNLIKKNSEHEFTLYEKQESLSLEEGYGIQLSTNVIKLLNQINFKKIDKTKIFHPSRVDFYDIKSKKICEVDLTQFNTQDNKYTTLQRSVLIEFLKENIYTEHLKFGKKIKEVSEIKGKILIKFEDNTNDLVDIVVGADGIFSNTRAFFEKIKNKPKFKKAVAIRTVLKSNFKSNLDKNNISLLMGKNCHLVIYPINQNMEHNLVCIIRVKNFNPDDVQSIINNKVLSQNSELKNIFKGELESWPLYSTQKIIPSENSKVFYIGDAFNGLLPTLAQGAGQSIESAFELFNLLQDSKADIQKIYFYNRSKRVKIVRKRSNLNFFAFHFSSKIMQFIRNFLMKLILKRKKFINYYLGSIYKN